jgi:hypothetical protein
MVVKMDIPEIIYRINKMFDRARIKYHIITEYDDIGKNYKITIIIPRGEENG